MFAEFMNTTLDIVTSPIKLGATIVDDVIETEIADYVEHIKDSIKLDESEEGL